MSVVRFRKSRQIPDMLRRPTREMTFIPDSNRGDEFTADPDDHLDDFEDEIRMTRANDALMKLLEERATQPATVSLRDLKQQFDDC
jgi:hypothetical protein